MIAILMATYNGERFIQEQIDSIINQSYTDWSLYIRDDGSTDNTVSIISSYSKKYPKKIVVLTDDTIHRGPTQSFMWLLQSVKADYYMFSDQDDIWLKNKVEISINMIKKHEEKEKPALCFTDLSIANENGDVIAYSMWRYTNMDKYLCGYSALYAASVTGCTMILNNKAKEVSMKYKDLNGVHDNIITLATIKNKGIIIPIHQPTILYRQHSNNVLGVKQYDNSLSYRIKNLRRILSVTINHLYLTYKINNINFIEFIILNTAKKILIRHAN